MWSVSNYTQEEKENKENLQVPGEKAAAAVVGKGTKRDAPEAAVNDDPSPNKKQATSTAEEEKKEEVVKEVESSTDKVENGEKKPVQVKPVETKVVEDATKGGSKAEAVPAEQ